MTDSTAANVDSDSDDSADDDSDNVVEGTAAFCVCNRAVESTLRAHVPV